MRLMIVGHLEGHIAEAGKIALRRGAKVVHCEALGALRNGKGADLAMVDVKQPIGAFITNLEKERINVPVVACGIGSDATAAVKAIREGAKEYVPLPPDADMIAAVLQAVTEDNGTMIAGAPSMQALLKIVERIAPSDATVLIRGESGTGKEVMSNFIRHQSVKMGRLLRLTVRLFLKTFWNLNFLAMKRAHLQGQPRAVLVSLKKHMAARCCLMKCQKCIRSCKLNFCALFRKKKSPVLAVMKMLRLMCELSRHRTVI